MGFVSVRIRTAGTFGVAKHPELHIWPNVLPLVLCRVCLFVESALGQLVGAESASNLLRRVDNAVAAHRAITVTAVSPTARRPAG